MPWAVEWRSVNKLDGDKSHFIWNGMCPYLFRTRREARAFIKEKYGFIADRPDLQNEPHGWKMPTPQKVKIRIEKVEKLR